MKIHELGHIVFFVSDLTKSADFYSKILGFKEIHRDTYTALYSTGRTHHEMLLIAVGGKAEPRPMKPGFYHAGLKIGNTDDELRAAIKELQDAGVTIVGTADHHVTHSVYVKDPDGNELELYVDVTDEWKTNPGLILEETKHLHL